MNTLKNKLNYPDVKNVRIDDAFWSAKLEKVASVTVADVWNKYEKDGTRNNFINIAEGKNDKTFYGTPWQDGMIYEIIRGVADLSTTVRDLETERKIDEYVELITKAQNAVGDGYINTFTLIRMPESRFGQNSGFLIMQHDLYNAGCLFEAGVHYYRATGKKALLSVAVKMGNYICSEIGYPPKKNVVAAHPMIEQATVQMYTLFRDEPELAKELGAKAEDYLELSKFWIDYRGVHDGRVSFPHYMREYAQDHQPLRKQKEAVGHAVRAALLYCGMTALANETDDEELKKGALDLWENVTETKMHINGGIGAAKEEERFGYQYELPSGAYLETCAAVAFAFWAGEMHRAYGQASMFDVFERSVYNNILASLSESGVKYTYVNPLISDGTVERWEWHKCPCCPPMLLKMMGALKSYIFSYDECGNFYLNLHIGSELDNGLYSASYKNGKLTVASKTADKIKLHIRIPEYAAGFRVNVGGVPAEYVTENGYAVIDAANGTELEICYNTEIYREVAHPYAWENCYAFIHLDKVAAVRKGPFLYCAEGIDNNDNVDFTVAKNAELTETEDGFIVGKTVEGGSFKLIPYYKWNNRGNCKMRILLSQEGADGNINDLNGWEHKLYRRFER